MSYFSCKNSLQSVTFYEKSVRRDIVNDGALDLIFTVFNKRSRAS